jgi:hypothetical protein
MNRFAMIGVAFLFSYPAIVHAQDSLVGKYSGRFDAVGVVNYTVGVTLEISSVDDGKVKGVATLSMRTACNGQYPFAGTYKDDQLVVRATQKGGPAGDCDFGFRGKREGDTLVGTIGKYEITLRK